MHIISTVTGGGVERRRLSLAKHLNKELFQILLVGTHKAGFIAEQIELNGVPIVEIGNFNGPFHWQKHRLVQKIIEDFKPHILHGAVFEGVTLAAINGLLKRVPIIILEETSDPQNRSLKANFLLRVFSFVADRFVAISESVSHYLKLVAKVSPKKVIVINNGVEIPRNVSNEEIGNLKRMLKIGETDFIVGSVGRLFNEHKRFTDIVEALTLLKGSNIKLLIVGDGPDEFLIRNHVRRKLLEDRVIFVGYQFDTAPYYKLMDVFCIASQREGFGLVAAEAMLHRLPVIASEVGGLKDIVVDGKTGFLVQPKNSRQIADKISLLAADMDLRKSMGSQGKRRAIENYTEIRYCKEVEDLYISLLKRKNIAL